MEKVDKVIPLVTAWVFNKPNGSILIDMIFFSRPRHVVSVHHSTLFPPLEFLPFHHPLHMFPSPDWLNSNTAEACPPHMGHFFFCLR